MVILPTGKLKAVCPIMCSRTVATIHVKLEINFNVDHFIIKQRRTLDLCKGVSVAWMDYKIPLSMDTNNIIYKLGSKET